MDTLTLVNALLASPTGPEAASGGLPPLPFKDYAEAGSIPPPSQPSKLAMPLGEALASRRSSYRYASDALDLLTLGTLLDGGYGINRFAAAYGHRRIR